MSNSCKERCLRYLKKNPNRWIASGHIQRLAQQKSSYTGAYVARELRKLAEAKEIQVTQIKNHAHYKYEIQGNQG